MADRTLSHVLVTLREGNRCSDLWGTAKVYGAAGIRYSMRVGKIGVTAHLTHAVALPSITEVTMEAVPPDGCLLAVVWSTKERHAIARDESWLTGILHLIRDDYGARITR